MDTAAEERVIRFYNGRGTAEQWIKEGKYALKWTRLSCHRFIANQVRLQLFALAYNLANFLRRLALPQGIRHWSLTTLREKLIKIGAKIVRHARYVTFQMAEVAISRRRFQQILRRIERLTIKRPLHLHRDDAVSRSRNSCFRKRTRERCVPRVVLRYFWGPNVR
jgi:hypothetical protein